MRIHHLLTAAASVAALSIAAPAMAQTMQPAPPNPPAPAIDPTTDPAAPYVGEDEAAPPAGNPVPGDIAASANAPAAIPMSSPTPVEQAYMLKAGDPTVTSNTPVPDTPATRAAFGGPDSNGGRQTRPVGN